MGWGGSKGRRLPICCNPSSGPLEEWLDRQVDRRLVRTFFLALAAIVRLRHSRSGLLLSELGAHILSPSQAPAGTKRLSNLLRSPKWSHTLLEKFLWHRADQGLTQLDERGETALAIWDESVLEKPESIALEGLCPGPFQQGSPPEAHQARLLQSSGRAAGIRARPAMAHRHGGEDAGTSRPGRHAVVDQPGQAGQPRAGTDRILALPVRPGVAAASGPRLRPGIRRRPWLRELGRHQLRLIMRWPTRYHLADAKGERPAWQITRGKRSQDHRQIWDLNRRQYRKTGIVAAPVSHPKVDGALWLVVSRPGKGRKPWYLLTNETIETTDDAWRVVMAYARRWQVEMCYRACKTDLAMESPPALVLGKPAQAPAHGQPGLRLYALVAVPLSLTHLVQDLLRGWCHRTGERYRQAAIPLSRLRAALSALLG